MIDLVVADTLGERLGVSPPCDANESQPLQSGKPNADVGPRESEISDFKSPPSDFPQTESLKPKTCGEAETIGTTWNHPFWSVDRQEFVQAGSLEIGERLQTLSGDVKVVQQKLPRPGPQPVFNLEVHFEHVYFVGEDGVLVHNAYNTGATVTTNGNLRTETRSDGVTKRFYIKKDGHWHRVESAPKPKGVTEHHLLTVENRTSTAAGGPYTPQFEAMAKRAGMDLDEPLNKIEVLDHRGPHPEANRETYRRLLAATNGASDYQSAFFAEIVRLRKDAVTPGSKLNKLLTGK